MDERGGLRHRLQHACLVIGRLQGEKRAQATPLRVEKLAKEQLQMRTTTPAITQYVRPDGTVIPAVVAPPPAPPATPAPKPVARTQR